MTWDHILHMYDSEGEALPPSQKGSKEIPAVYPDVQAAVYSDEEVDDA